MRSEAYEIAHIHADIAADLAQKRRSYVATSVHRHRCNATIRMPKLLVRAALPYLNKALLLEAPDYFTRLEDRDRSHRRSLSHTNRLGTNELRLQRRLAVFEQHLDHLSKIFPKLLLARSLAVRARKSRDITNEKPCIRIAFNDGSECPHGGIIRRRATPNYPEWLAMRA